MQLLKDPQTLTKENSDIYEAMNNNISHVHFVFSFLPDSREKSLSITKLQEMLMWFNQAVYIKNAKEVS